MTDALGQEIVLGNVYGYSQRQNGLVKVRIGRAVKLNERVKGKQSSVTLAVIHTGKAVYDNDIESDSDVIAPYASSKRDSISVTSNSIFPLPENVQLNWKIKQ